MARNDIAERLRFWSDAGWTAEKTNGGHWRLSHPDASKIVFAPATPSDWRSVHNLEAEMHRALGRPNLIKNSIISKKQYKKATYSPLFNMYQTEQVAPKISVQKPIPTLILTDQKYTKQEVEAWGFCYVRMRLENKDISLIKSLKSRFREDEAFAHSIVFKFENTTDEKKARLRMALRNPNRFKGNYEPKLIPASVAVPIPVKLSPSELFDLLQVKFNSLEKELIAEKSLRKQIENEFLNFKADSASEIHELRIRKNQAESVRDDIIAQMTEQKEKKMEIADPRIVAIEKTIDELKIRMKAIETKPVFVPVRSPEQKPSLLLAQIPKTKQTVKLVLNKIESVPFRFKKARLKQNLSQTQLADKIGVTSSMVSSWEAGRYVISEGKKEKICKCLKVPKTYFD